MTWIIHISRQDTSGAVTVAREVACCEYPLGASVYCNIELRPSGSHMQPFHGCMQSAYLHMFVFD
jgi:hypothetical protein